MSGHYCTVTETAMDDGVHVQCQDCDFDRNVGYAPTVDEVYEVQNDHQEEVADA